MSGLIFTGLFTVTATVILIAWLKKRKTWKRLEKIPGPKTLPIFGNALSMEKESAAFYLQLESLCFEHIDAGMCRIWLGPHLTVLIYRADLLEPFFNGSKHITKSPFYRIHEPWLKKGLLTSTGPKWYKRRKMITPTFHFKILEEFLEVMNEQAQIMVDLFDRKVGGEPFDVQSYLAHCALDIICETAMGRHVNAQEDVDSAYVKAIHRMSEYFFQRLKEPWLWPEFLFRLHSSGRGYFKSVGTLHEFTRKVIRERSAQFDRLWEKQQQQSGKTESGEKAAANEDDEETGGKPIRIGKRMAFLDMLLLSAKKDPTMTLEDIQEEVDTFMFEGHDTTAATAAWVFYVIGKYPEIQAKLHDEVDRVFGNDDRQATMEDLSQLKYLECVFKESMRLFPTVPLFGREVAEDCEIGEYFLTKGATVFFMSVPLHRDPKYFPDPEKMDPDRWLTDNPTDKHPFCYIPFSAGLRNCIGQKFAVMEEKALLSLVLRKFTITCTDKGDIARSGLLILRPANGIHVTLARRDK